LINVAQSYLATLISGTGDDLVRLFGEDGIIADPHKGHVQVAPAIRAFSGAIKRWLDSELRTQRLRITASEDRVSSEDILQVKNGKEWIQLPVGTVVCKDADAGANELHVYYTQWPFSKSHTVRRALFPEPGNKVQHTGQIRNFFMSLTSGDVDQALDCLEADIYMREGSGPPYVHWGTENVRQYFVGLFVEGAPMIRGETLTDDGRCAVMEFTVFGWNGTEWNPDLHQAGLAVYQRSTEGRIQSIRIYDDVAF